MASSSSPRPWRYDVFLSFRGEDTRRTIVSHLYSGLQSKGIITFKDDRKLRTGDSIPTELVEAIEESRFAVVVISKNYASSGWCLDELEMIVERKQKGMLTVVPIFYDVDPSDVRYQKRTFAEAFEKHNARKRAEKVQKWRAALSEVAGLSGVNSRTCPDDDAIVREIVGDISSRLFSVLCGDFGDLVGMDAHWEALVPLLQAGLGNEVRMIGIWGMGGIGKTTIAKCLYEKVSCEFPLHCFMGNIKKISHEHGLEYLQERFLSEILRQNDIKLKNLEFGSSAIQGRLSHQKVLAILDDVDKLDQLHALARETNWFGSGSIVIITTRDKGLLISQKVKLVYEVKCLGDDAALRLFNNFAFRGMPPSDAFMKLSVRASRLVQGLPLALRVFGSSLCGRTQKEWEASIHSLRGDPYRDVMESLKVSYDGLYVRDKFIFLCVACLFSEEHVSHVAQLVEGKDLEISNSLKMLAEKSLIDISNGRVIVHDLIQEMAKEIVHQQSNYDPARCRFLWDANHIYDVLADGMVTNAVEGISLNMSEMPNFPAGNWDFQNMQNLRFVKIYNTINCTEELLQSLAALHCLPWRLRLLDWSNCPLKTLPSTFRAGCLVELRLPFSDLEKLWEGTLSLGNLKRMDLSCSFELKEIPDLSLATNIEELDLSHCYSLVNVPSSFSSLKKLTRLSTRGCRKLECLPSTVGLKLLEVLNSGACSRLKSFPELPEGIVELYLHEARLEVVLDESIQNLTALENLDLSDCKMLLQIPSTIGNLSSLRKLNMRNCKKLKNIPNTIGNLSALQELDLGFCESLTNIPNKIGSLSALETLTLSGCKMLSAIPSLSTFPYLRRLCFSNLNMLEIPNDIGSLRALQHLDLCGNDFEILPASIKQLLLLEELHLCHCKYLRLLPVLPPNLKYLYANDCSSLISISNVSKHSLQKLTLCNCFKLDSDTELRIQRMICSNPTHTGEVKRWAYLRLRERSSYFFNHQSKKRSLTVHLPQSSPAHKPVGFVSEIVIACETQHRISDFRVCCRWNGEANQTGHTYSCPDNLPSHVSDSCAESDVHLFFSCNFGEERSSDKISFDFELDCKMSYKSNCCQIERCAVSLRFSESNVRDRAEKVQEGGKALSDAAGTAGVESRKCQVEAAMVHQTMGDISDWPFSMLPRDSGDIIGMDIHLEALIPLLKVGLGDEVRMIGIWGMEGVGKTTIAKYLYDKVSSKFPLHCFMDNVNKISGEHGLVYLQKWLLSKILCQDLELWSVELESDSVKARLSHQRVLLILDGVDKLDQLHALAKVTRWFGPGSRFIITTRDKGLLISHEIKLEYNVQCLGNEAALRLFNRFAFKERPLSDDFMELSVRALNLVQGLPLTLKVFGSFLCGRPKEEWEAAIHKLRLSGDPHMVMKSLKVSYDGLDEQYKATFLCVACLFCEKHVSHVAQCLDVELEVLKMLAEKALIDISKDGHVIVHSSMQEMAKDIVYAQSSNDPGRRRFLWDAKEIYDVLEDGAGADAIEGMSLNMSDMPQFPTKNKSFGNMPNLRFLKIHNSTTDNEELLQMHAAFNHLPHRLRLLDWHGCPLTTLPSTFHAECLVELRLPFSKLEKLSEGTLLLVKLRRMDLSDCYNLKEIPSLCWAKELEELDLSYCVSLVKVPSSFTSLEKLTMLSVRYCSKLEYLPSAAGLKSLKVFDVQGCLSLKSFPELSQSIVELYVARTRIRELLESIQNLASLKILDLSSCWHLKFIPRAIGRLTALKTLRLLYCQLLDIPDTIGNLTALVELDLTGCKNLKDIPETIGNLTALETLSLRDCATLLGIPITIGNLTALVELNLTGCWKLKDIPETIGNLTALETFSLRGCATLLGIPITIGNLTALVELNLTGCRNIKDIPETIGSLTALETLSFRRCARLLRIPITIGYLTALKMLDLRECLRLRNIPPTIGCLTALESLLLSRCQMLTEIPSSIGNLRALRVLDLQNCRKLNNIPNTIGTLTALETLEPSDCYRLLEIRSTLGDLTSLGSLSAEGYSRGF